MLKMEVSGKATIKPARKLFRPEYQEAKAMIKAEIKIFVANNKKIIL